MKNHKITVSEKLLESRFVKTVKSWGGQCVKMESNLVSGLPDRMVLLHGAFVAFVEFKSTGEQPEPLQLLWHGKLRALGFKVYIVDSYETEKAAVTAIKEDAGI